VSAETVRDALDRALDAYVVLEELGEQIEDEWSYVADLTDAWRTRFDEVAAHRGDADAPDDVSAAIDHAIDEIARIEDPHRAIDWLSTFPQVVLIAIGERP
jgi:3-hydroxy-3-methylglutaryl CoA synthase